MLQITSSFEGSVWRKNGLAWMRMAITSHNVFVDIVEVLERGQESRELSGQEFETFGQGVGSNMPRNTGGR